MEIEICGEWHEKREKIAALCFALSDGDDSRLLAVCINARDPSDQIEKFKVAIADIVWRTTIGFWARSRLDRWLNIRRKLYYTHGPDDTTRSGGVATVYRSRHRGFC